MKQMLFVYGTLRLSHDGPMAAWLRSVARPAGKAVAKGALYHVGANYPGFVPGEEGEVVGDLFAMPDSVTVLLALDDYEECAPHFPEPHEYRRARLVVQTERGPVDAWTYVYAWDASGLERIESGDFLG